MGAWHTDLVRTYGQRFDVNCSILFTELPLLERPAAAKAAGFDGVELWWPFAEPEPGDKAAVVIEKSQRVNVRMLADLYHLALMSEDLSDTLSRYAPLIAHVQVADVPGRGAPGTGTLDFESLFAQLTGQGYLGGIGLEFIPNDMTDSSTSFGWL
jgi:hydroxypyruvate isomerase